MGPTRNFVRAVSGRGPDVRNSTLSVEPGTENLLPDKRSPTRLERSGHAGRALPAVHPAPRFAGLTDLGGEAAGARPGGTADTAGERGPAAHPPAPTCSGPRRPLPFAPPRSAEIIRRIR